MLYRGEVVEAGDAEQVITAPQHPYTRLLVDSIPWPDLDDAWGDGQPILRDERRTRPAAPLPAAALPSCRRARTTTAALSPQASSVFAPLPAPGDALPCWTRTQPRFLNGTRRRVCTDTHHHQENSAMKITRITHPRRRRAAAPELGVREGRDRPARSLRLGRGTLEWKTRGVVGCSRGFRHDRASAMTHATSTQLVELLNKAAFWPLGVFGLTAISAIEQACWDIKGKDLGVARLAVAGRQGARPGPRLHAYRRAQDQDEPRHSRDIAGYGESCARTARDGLHTR